MVFKEMKFRVSDEAQSKRIQDALFALGYGWTMSLTKEYENTDKPFLYAERDGRIMHSGPYNDGFFENEEQPEYVEYLGLIFPLVKKPDLTATLSLEALVKDALTVRPRKQFLQDRQVELLKAMLADAEEGKMINDDYASELAENHQILESLA